MKQTIIVITLISTLLSCQNDKDNSDKATENKEQKVIIKKNQSKNKTDLTKNQIDSLTNELDELFNDQLLAKYFYPNMSGCGGELYGYYKDSTLVITDATFRAELGFSSRKMYWYKNDIIKIIYRKHLAEWDKYRKNYPADKFDWDSSKMTYTDTIYQIKLGNEYRMEKLTDDKLISKNLDSLLIEELVDCGLDMKSELGIEKIKK